MQVGKSKIGRFLLFIGLILLVIFFAVDQSLHPSYAFFCVGVVVLLLGGILFVRGHPQTPPDDSMRFRTLRRWRQQQRQLKEDKKQAKKDHLY